MLCCPTCVCARVAFEHMPVSPAHPRAAAAGAAIIIGMSQVRYILGYRVPRQDSLHEQIAVLIENRAGFKWQVRLLSSKRLNRY